MNYDSEITNFLVLTQMIFNLNNPVNKSNRRYEIDFRKHLSSGN